MYSAIDIAKYFLCLCEAEGEDVVTGLKLQKLLYYAQGVYLAMKGDALFHERIKAWEHGPVVPQVWHEYRDVGRQPLSPDPDFDPDTIDSESKSILDEVYDVFGQFSAWKLRQMTHAEPPWKATNINDEITRDRLIDYFKTQID